MILKPLSADDMEQVRLWRHELPETLRTPYQLTREMQQQYYRDVICNRESHTRYWGLWIEEGYNHDGGDWEYDAFDFIGLGGVEGIAWESGIAELSLLIGPEYRGKGYGREAVDLILDQAFNHLRLTTVFAECYTSSPAVGFWEKMKPDFVTELPRRKYYDGKLWNSKYYTWINERI